MDNSVLESILASTQDRRRGMYSGLPRTPYVNEMGTMQNYETSDDPARAMISQGESYAGIMNNMSGAVDPAGPIMYQQYPDIGALLEPRATFPTSDEQIIQSFLPDESFIPLNPPYQARRR